MADRHEWRPGRAIYQLHSLGASGAPAVNPDVNGPEPTGHGLGVVEGWLDHIADLGCGGVLLTPIAVSSTHGYDTVDPFRVDQRLGDDADFQALVDGCHARDLHLLLDGVFNHVGRDFPPFRDVLANGRDSAFAEWFRLDFDRDDGDGFGYHSFEGHQELVSLNHRSDVVLDWAADVAIHWLDRGADGWRLDVGYAIPRPFLLAMSERIRDRHPDTFLFGEIIHGDYRDFVVDGGLDSATQYELYKAIWSSLNDANLFELAWALDRHQALVADFAPVTFIGNHDVSRIASQLADRRHLAAALAVLATVAGLPCVYYGDELAWTGVKEDRAGGDDAIRPPLPANAEPADDEQQTALQLHRDLLALRRANPWLTRAALEVGSLANRSMTYTVSHDDRALLVVLDVDGNAVPPAGWRAVLHTGWACICER